MLFSWLEREKGAEMSAREAHTMINYFSIAFDRIFIRLNGCASATAESTAHNGGQRWQ